MLQYLSDPHGKHTAVVIPIKDWKIITKKHKDLLDLVSETEKPKAKLKLSELMAGSISNETADNMHLELKKMRDEWERDTY